MPDDDQRAPAGRRRLEPAHRSREEGRRAADEHGAVRVELGVAVTPHGHRAPGLRKERGEARPPRRAGHGVEQGDGDAGKRGKGLATAEPRGPHPGVHGCDDSERRAAASDAAPA